MRRLLIVASFKESILSFRGHLIKEFQKKGIEVHVAAPGLSNNVPEFEELTAFGVTPHDISFSRAGVEPAQDLLAIFKLIRLVRKIRPDCCLTYTVKPNIYGTSVAAVCRVQKRFVLISGLGYVFTGERADGLARLIYRLYRFALAKAHLIFFQNPDDRKLFSDKQLLSPNTPSIVVNGSGIDLEKYRWTENRSAPASFLMLGRFLANKGVREYAHAARLVKQCHPEAYFALAGWIDKNPDSINRYELESWRNARVLDYLGNLKDVRSAIMCCTVFVLPSYREGTPRSVLEAMAMGRPIITTDVPGCRETVIHGENGFLVPPRSASALAEAMRRFIDDPDLAALMGKRSREIAEEKYDVHKVNAVMLREMGIT